MPLITEQDLSAAIAECKGKRNPDATTCIKLAALYTVRDHLFPETPEKLGYRTQERHSYASAPEANTVQIDSMSEFAEAVNGRNARDVWPIIDELMGTLQVISPRLYSAVMQKFAY